MVFISSRSRVFTENNIGKSLKTCIKCKVHKMSKLFFRLLCLKLNFLKQVGPSCFLFIEKLTVGLPSVSPRVSAPQYRKQVSPVIAADGTLVLFSFISVFVHLLIRSFVCLPSSALLFLFIHFCYMIFCNTGTFKQYSEIPILLI